MAKTLVERIITYNKGRYPQLLALKYQALAESPFRFFRGTDHIFFEDYAKKAPVKDKTRVWACGDLHIENFGSYRAANKQVYFDINDFDEAALAPASWEIARFLVSIHAASSYWEISPSQAAGLCSVFLDHYRHMIMDGKAYAIEKETTSPLIRIFFAQVENRSDKDLLMKRILLKPMTIRTDNQKALEAKKKERNNISSLFHQYADKKYPGIGIHDLALRISGTGSLGLRRYIILAEKGVNQEKFLFDLKQARPSSMALYSPLSQPPWKSEADRIVTIQKLMPYAIPPFLDALQDGKKSYILRQLQSSADKFDIRLCKGKLGHMAVLMQEMASALASAQIRSASRYGSCSVDELIAFASRGGWKNKLMAFASEYNKQMTRDFNLYKKLYAKGAFKI